MKRSLFIWILRILAILGLVAFVTFFIVSMVSGSLGGALLFTPAVVSGAVLVLLLFLPLKWNINVRRAVIIAVAAVFIISGKISFGIMFKFIQPTVLPKAVVPIGNPWVIEGNIFTKNDYNNPVVVKLGDTYWMYFHLFDDMMAASSPDGRAFSEPVKLFKGEMPTVTKLADGSSRMYYFVNADEPGAANPNGPGPMTCHDDCKASKHKLVSAVSTDGLHWEQEPGVRLEPSNTGYERDTMIHPSVIQLGDGSYKLYYDGEVDATGPFDLAPHYRKILSASSKDGLVWTRDPGYRIDEQPIGTWEAYSPKAIYENGQVIIRFTTPNGIYQAGSTDTLNFTISQNPIFSPGSIPMPGPDGALNSYQDSFVLKVDGGHRMYFWINGKGTWSAFQKD